MKNKYYQITTNGREATINIYGDITSWKWEESDVAAYDLKTEIDALDVDTIHVCINSYGGEVAEALAICSMLQRHKAKVITYNDGFACSAASVIFAVGEERVMNPMSLLMIHNCVTYMYGYSNSEQLRKLAEDMDKITKSSIEAYKQVVNISEDEIKAMMDNETWISAEEALEMGFATRIAEREESTHPSQSGMEKIRNIILSSGEKAKSNGELETVMEKLGRVENAVDRLEQLEDVITAILKKQDTQNQKGLENEGIPKNKRAIAFLKAIGK